jgi:hypothetical protein
MFSCIFKNLEAVQNFAAISFCKFNQKVQHNRRVLLSKYITISSGYSIPVVYSGVPIHKFSV